jgi:hypothetical protein
VDAKEREGLHLRVGDLLRLRVDGVNAPDKHVMRDGHFAGKFRSQILKRNKR